MDKRGFTLVELLVAMVVSGIVMTGIYSAFKNQQDSFIAQDQVAEVQQNLRAGLNFFTHELRMAGYDPDNAVSAGFTTATASTVGFSFVADNDGIDNDNADGDDDTTTGVDEANEMNQVQYELFDDGGDGDTDLVRSVYGGDKVVIAENIENIQFYYTLADGTQTLAPGSLGDIRAVTVSILARADRPDKNYTHSGTYPPKFGAEWVPTNDNYRRRFQIIRINCRNMGL